MDPKIPTPTPTDTCNNNTRNRKKNNSKKGTKHKNVTSFFRLKRSKSGNRWQEVRCYRHFISKMLFC